MNNLKSNKSFFMFPRYRQVVPKLAKIEKIPLGFLGLSENNFSKKCSNFKQLDGAAIPPHTI